MSCHAINIFTIEAERGLSFSLVCFGKVVLNYVHGSYTIYFNLALFNMCFCGCM